MKEKKIQRRELWQVRNYKRINDERKNHFTIFVKENIFTITCNRTKLASNIVDACLVCIAIDFLKTNEEHDRPFASNGWKRGCFMRALDRIEVYCFRNVVSRKSCRVHDHSFIRLFPLELIAISHGLFL